MDEQMSERSIGRKKWANIARLSLSGAVHAEYDVGCSMQLYMYNNCCRRPHLSLRTRSQQCLSTYRVTHALSHMQPITITVAGECEC